MKNPWVIIGIITVVLFGGAIILSGKSTEQNNQGVEVKQHVKGNTESQIKLVEYSDFQCPACSAFQPVVEQIMSDYGDKISFEYKHFPLFLANPGLHRFSVTAAVAAEAAGQQDKFYEYHDLLFKNQQAWSSLPSPTATFEQYASDLGLDMEKFRFNMKSSLLTEKVKNEFAEGRALGITGTPTFFLNGERMEFTTYQEFVEKVVFAIDPNALASSTANTESGTSVRFGL